MQIFKTPNEQINNTTAINIKNQSYNEMDFRRSQGGKIKQPDYILVFRENGQVPNMFEAKRASKQWGDMPIVVVDKDKCLESEKEKVEKMIKQYEREPSEALNKEIKQKIKNNTITRGDFGVDIKNKEILEKVLHEKKSSDLLESSIEATEISTKTDIMKGSIDTIKQRQIEKTQPTIDNNYKGRDE